MSTQSSLHDGHRKRMTEKLLDNPSALLEHELLEIMLFGALPRKNTNDIAHKLIKKFGSIRNIFNADAKALQAVDGVGKSVSAQIVLTGILLKEMSKRIDEEVYIKNLSDVKEYFFDKFIGEKEEKFLFAMLNKSNRLLGVTEFKDDMNSQVSAGASELANSLSVFRPNYVIALHNHPSGVAMPSANDDLATAKIIALCELHGVSLIDHVIFTPNEVYSYNSDGRLNKLRQSADFNKFFNGI